MKFLPPVTAIAAFVALTFVAGSSALAQRQAPTPEQRLDRLERQVQQVQRQIFPKGRPADTAGFSDEPAATQSSVATLDQRLDALERQMADILRQSEENGHTLQSLQADLAKLRADHDQRIGALEQRVTEAPTAATTPTIEAPAVTSPKAATSKPAVIKPRTEAVTTTASSTGGPEVAAVTDPGEEAYSEGFHQWQAGQFDQAITSLRAFTAAYPKHRRVSYAKNLIGRAQLDKGQARAAAETFLANYRSNPTGERAPDSLYYLGQALLQLGQPGQACNAYKEIDAVYGSKLRADLKQQVKDAEAKAQCT